MAAIGRMRRKYAKGMMKKLTSGGDFVSDQESAAMKGGMKQASDAALNAQSRQLNQFARGVGGGAGSARQLAAGQQAIAGQQARAQVAGEAAAQQNIANLRAQRAGEAMTLGREFHQLNRENLKAAGKTAANMGMMAVNPTAQAGAAAIGRSVASGFQPTPGAAEEEEPVEYLGDSAYGPALF